MDSCTLPIQRIALLFILAVFTLCHGFQQHQARHQSSHQRTLHDTIGIGIGIGQFQPRQATSAILLPMTDKRSEDCSSSRRKFVQSALTHISMLSPAILIASLESADARNLPVSNGADTSRTGSVDTLKPIILLRALLGDLKVQLRKKETVNLEGLPATEDNFKRIFDAYSDPVSYKQKFLDQNAFLVYYTKGFDGPGRPNIEDGNENEKQTLQFGARNEAWINWENFLVELKFVGEEDDKENQAVKYLDDTIRCVDNYIKLAPPEDVREAQKAVDRYW